MVRMITLREFNEAPSDRLVADLADIFGSVELAEAVASTRPSDSVDELCETASRELHLLDDDVILTSINAHPPIGGETVPGSRSASEQSAAVEADGAMAAVRELQLRYRDHFGFNFLIRATGLTSRQILDNLTVRMDNPPEAEVAVAHDQLDQINQLRLRGFVTGSDD